MDSIVCQGLGGLLDNRAPCSHRVWAKLRMPVARHGLPVRRGNSLAAGVGKLLVIAEAAEHGQDAISTSAHATSGFLCSSCALVAQMRMTSENAVSARGRVGRPCQGCSIALWLQMISVPQGVAFQGRLLVYVDDATSLVVADRHEVVQLACRGDDALSQAFEQDAHSPVSRSKAGGMEVWRFGGSGMERRGQRKPASPESRPQVQSGHRFEPSRAGVKRAHPCRG